MSLGVNVTVTVDSTVEAPVWQGFVVVWQIEARLQIAC